MPQPVYQVGSSIAIYISQASALSSATSAGRRASHPARVTFDRHTASPKLGTLINTPTPHIFIYSNPEHYPLSGFPRHWLASTNTLISTALNVSSAPTKLPNQPPICPLLFDAPQPICREAYRSEWKRTPDFVAPVALHRETDASRGRCLECSAACRISSCMPTPTCVST